MTRAFWLLVAFLVGCSASGCAQPPATPVSTDPCADQAFRDQIILHYEEDILQAQEAWGLPEGWGAWATTPQHRGWFSNTHVHAKCRNPDAEIKVLVTYFGGAGRKHAFFRDSWTQEKENRFRDLMEERMEKVFSGLNFYFTFNSEGSKWISEEEANLIAVVGYDGPASFATDKYTYLIYPTIITHEAAHLCPQPYDENGWCMSYGHHYCDDDRDDHESCAPPGEYEVGCVMHRNALIFGPLEQTISNLDYPLSPEGREELENEINDLGATIKGMLPEEMVVRGEAKEQTPHNHGLELTPEQLRDHLAHKELLRTSQYWLSAE